MRLPTALQELQPELPGPGVRVDDALQVVQGRARALPHHTPASWRCAAAAVFPSLLWIRSISFSFCAPAPPSTQRHTSEQRAHTQHSWCPSASSLGAPYTCTLSFSPYTDRVLGKSRRCVRPPPSVAIYPTRDFKAPGTVMKEKENHQTRPARRRRRRSLRDRRTWSSAAIDVSPACPIAP